MKLLRIFAAVFMFAGILAGCIALLLLVLLMVRFPPLLIAVLLACWIFCRLVKALAPGQPRQSPPLHHRNNHYPEPPGMHWPSPLDREHDDEQIVSDLRLQRRADTGRSQRADPVGRAVQWRNQGLSASALVCRQE